jgi:hypothetical protein
MTLAASVGQGTATFSVTGSRSDGDSRRSTDYTTYEFVATPANGWRFVGWETRQRSQSYTSNYDGQWSDWTSWSSFSSSSTATREFTTGSSYNYGGTWGSGGTHYEHEVRAVFAEEGFTVAVDVSSESPANSGSVSGSIIGNEDDFSIIANTTSGSCNLGSKAEGEKRLEISTTSGSVNISFTE